LIGAKVEAPDRDLERGALMRQMTALTLAIVGLMGARREARRAGRRAKRRNALYIGGFKYRGVFRAVSPAFLSFAPAHGDLRDAYGRRHNAGDVMENAVGLMEGSITWRFFCTRTSSCPTGFPRVQKSYLVICSFMRMRHFFCTRTGLHTSGVPTRVQKVTLVIKVSEPVPIWRLNMESVITWRFFCTRGTPVPRNPSGTCSCAKGDLGD